jgi:phosphoglycerate dehydrogenase-like enzyme
VTVAEHTIAMGLASVRKLVRANCSMREGRWERLTLGPSELEGKTWGLIGFGEIGRALALRLRPFGLAKVLYYALQQVPKEAEEQCDVEYSSLPMLLKASDIVSLQVPLSGSTRNMIDAGALSSMKSGAYLINVSSGGSCRRARWRMPFSKMRSLAPPPTFFVEEPPSAANPLLKVPEDKILFSPHIAGLSPESVRRIMTESAENIARALAGQDPLHVVNP